MDQNGCSKRRKEKGIVVTIDLSKEIDDDKSNDEEVNEEREA